MLVGALFHHVDPAPKGGYTELPVSSHSSSWKPTSTGEDWDDEGDEGVCGLCVWGGVHACMWGCVSGWLQGGVYT